MGRTEKQGEIELFDKDGKSYPTTVFLTEIEARDLGDSEPVRIVTMKTRTGEVKKKPNGEYWLGTTQLFEHRQA